MDEAELQQWRAARLQAAVDRLADGQLNEFGRMMGWKDGSYVGQMLRGTRPVTEKLIRKIEERPSMAGWFNVEAQRDENVGLEYRIRSELLQRDVPEHILKTVLDLVTHCPPKRKVA